MFYGGFMPLILINKKNKFNSSKEIQLGDYEKHFPKQLKILFILTSNAMRLLKYPFNAFILTFFNNSYFLNN